MSSAERLRSWCVAFAAALAACETEPEPGVPAPPPSVSPLDSGAGLRPSGPWEEPSAVSSALRPLRESRLELPVPRHPSPYLAFVGDDLLRLTRAGVQVRKAPGFLPLQTYPLVEPRAVVALAGGLAYAVGRSAALELALTGDEPGASPRGRPTLFPYSILLPDLIAPSELWVSHADDTKLYDHSFEASASGLLPPRAELDLVRFDQRALVGLRDGSFVFSAGRELGRSFPRGGPRWLRLPEEVRSVTRILRDKKMDRIWLVDGDGVVVLAALHERVRSLRRIVTERRLFDVAISENGIFTLELEKGTPVRRFSLARYDLEGAEVWRTSFDRVPQAAGEDWAAGFEANVRLLVPRSGAWVVVGGPDQLDVWNAENRARVLSE
jgi:hypothetical protein